MAYKIQLVDSPIAPSDAFSPIIGVAGISPAYPYIRRWKSVFPYLSWYAPPRRGGPVNRRSVLAPTSRHLGHRIQDQALKFP